jgi:hypothetical protein
MYLSTFRAYSQTDSGLQRRAFGVKGGHDCPAENTLLVIGLVSCYLSCQGESLETTGTSDGIQHGLEG